MVQNDKYIDLIKSQCVCVGFINLKNSTIHCLISITFTIRVRSLMCCYCLCLLLLPLALTLRRHHVSSFAEYQNSILIFGGMGKLLNV
jgi:hypothetical protein